MVSVRVDSIRGKGSASMMVAVGTTIPSVKSVVEYAVTWVEEFSASTMAVPTAMLPGDSRLGMLLSGISEARSVPAVAPGATVRKGRLVMIG